MQCRNSIVAYCQFSCNRHWELQETIMCMHAGKLPLSYASLGKGKTGTELSVFLISLQFFLPFLKTLCLYLIKERQTGEGQTSDTNQ